MTNPLINPYRQNTFLAGMTASQSRFIGPQEELEWLLSRVSEQRPAAVSLIGPWGIGKSFLLRFLAAPQGARHVFSQVIGPRFHDDPERLRFVLIDLKEQEHELNPTRTLMELLYARLLDDLGELLQVEEPRLLPLERIPAARQPSVRALRALSKWEIAGARSRAEVEELCERFEVNLGPTQPGKLIELLSRLDSWGMRVIFLMDEFDTAASQFDLADFDQLRVLLFHASLVIATRRALSEVVPHAVQESPFFNLVQRLNLMSLHFLTEDEAVRLIIEPPGWFPETRTFRFSEADIAFILELTGLHPDLIRASCEYLYTWARRNNTYHQTDMLPAAEHLYLRALLQPRFVDFFAMLWRMLSREERHMLQKLAAGERHADRAQVIAPSSTLNALISRSYIVRSQGRYRLFAGLFHDYALAQGEGSYASEPAPELQLTELEMRLLELLKARAGEIVEREQIVATLYGVDVAQPQRRSFYNRLDALIFRLRIKLEREPLLIENIRGQGYRLVLTRS